MAVGTVVICEKTKAFAKICDRRQGRMNTNILDFKPVTSAKKPVVRVAGHNGTAMPP